MTLYERLLAAPDGAKIVCRVGAYDPEVTGAGEGGLITIRVKVSHGIIRGYAANRVGCRKRPRFAMHSPEILEDWASNLEFVEQLTR